MDSLSLKIVEVLFLMGSCGVLPEVHWAQPGRWTNGGIQFSWWLELAMNFLLCLAPGPWGLGRSGGGGALRRLWRPLAGAPSLKTLRYGDCTINRLPGQSYEIRLLENRKLGDFQDLSTKYVKVSLWGALPPVGLVGALAPGPAVGVQEWLGVQEKLQRESELLFSAACCPGGLGQAGGVECWSSMGWWTGRLCIPAWHYHFWTFLSFHLLICTKGL